MYNRAIQRIGSRAAGVAVGLAVLMGILMLTTTQVAAQEEDSLTECTDTAFAEYNSCLMESSWWFSRLICDLDWELEMAECTAEEIGEVRGAFEPH